MNFPATLVVVGEGTWQLSIPRTRNDEHNPCSAIWFCERCGQTYARLVVIDPFRNQQRRFLAWRGICRTCPPTHRLVVPGSIWLSWDHQFLNSLPELALRREFLLHYDHFTKGQSCPVPTPTPNSSAPAQSSSTPSPSTSSTLLWD